MATHDKMPGQIDILIKAFNLTQIAPGRRILYLQPNLLINNEVDLQSALELVIGNLALVQKLVKYGILKAEQRQVRWSITD